jgi:hypothetical protein
MATHHAQSDPDQCAERRRDEGVEPQRPREVPNQEVEADPLGVLDDEDEQQPTTGDGGDRSATHACPAPGTTALTRLDHRDPLVGTTARRSSTPSPTLPQNLP